MNWNPYFTQMLAMGTGIFASNKTSNTLVGLDQKFNISGNYPKSFSAGMSPEDAARYNAYWDSLENGTHTLPEMSAEDFSRFEFGIERLSRPDEIICVEKNGIVNAYKAKDTVENSKIYRNDN